MPFDSPIRIVSAAPALGTLARNPWLGCLKPNPAARARLFCFPYSGADASIFARWADGLPQQIEVCPVQLPGRGRRMSEPLITNLEEVVIKVADALDEAIAEKPFAFFGHSLGALISFEVTRLLRHRSAREPAHLFVSACGAPDLVVSGPRIHDLSEAEFVDKLRGLNGTTETVFADPELRRLFLPILRADFQLYETYQFKEEAPLGCAVTAIGGLQDSHVSRNHLDRWRQQTSGPFCLRMLAGDHFFMNSSRTALLGLIAQVMSDAEDRFHMSVMTSQNRTQRSTA